MNPNKPDSRQRQKISGCAIFVGDESGRVGITSIPMQRNIITQDLPLPVIAPITKKERKRALARAQFYSECLIRGIKPSDADVAARDVNQQYVKWWVDSKYENVDANSKKRKVDDEITPTVTPTTEIANSGAFSMSAIVTSEDESCRVSKNSKGTGRQARSRVGRSPASEMSQIPELKENIIQSMKNTGGDTTDPQFMSALNSLASFYSSRGRDERWSFQDNGLPMDGTWLALSKAEFSECKGINDRGEPTYLLGRVSFDMFRPTNMLCSLQGMFNQISPCSAEDLGRRLFYPSSVMKEEGGLPNKPKLRNYDLVCTLTIEPGQTREGEKIDPNSNENNNNYVVAKPLRCLLTNHGYCLPDPSVPNRLTIWFTGGTLEVEDEVADLEEWKKLFDRELMPSRSALEAARILAARAFMGAHLPEQMSDDGTMEYTLRRPIGGHGQVFCDVLYADHSLRILKGHRGSIFVFTKVPSFP